MTIRDVLLPLFVQVTLTFVLLFWMAFVRTRAIAGGAAKTREIALREPNWPPEVTKIANAFHNQLELPILFYVLTILAWDTHHAGTVFVALAWLFVLLRLIQAAIHVTDNHVRRRGLAFILSAIVLAIMWGNYMMEIVFGT
ncbi:MAG TPA: MAPEG family protein [Xanthobacteraceae bacterium]